jgi:hypothetical protein
MQALYRISNTFLCFYKKFNANDDAWAAIFDNFNRCSKI